MNLRGRHQLVAVSAVALSLISIAALDPVVTLRALVLSGVIAAIGAALIAALVASRPAKSVDEMTDAARALSRGDLSARAPLSAPGELGELSGALGRLSDHLASRIGALKHEQALLSSLVEALDEGVVTLDARRQVTRLNSAARAILGITRPTPFPADTLPRSRELLQALESAASGHSTDPVECIIGSRTVSLVARPLPLGDGLVLAIFDLTRVRQLETVRRDFVANVSHELRTPLTVITGFVETLSEDDVPPGLRKQFMQTIRMHTERMRQMVDDLLDLSRLESGKWTPQPTVFPLRGVAEEVAATYRPAAEARGLSLDIEIADDLRLGADRTAVRQVLSNLVDNAIRHTDGGSVAMYGSSDTLHVRFGVRDTGRGITAAHLPRIFERFYRVDPDRSRDSGGTGLGLAIVKHLAEAHGGSVHAESLPGEGTTIEVAMPHPRTERERSVTPSLP